MVLAEPEGLLHFRTTLPAFGKRAPDRFCLGRREEVQPEGELPSVHLPGLPRGVELRQQGPEIQGSCA